MKRKTRDKLLHQLLSVMRDRDPAGRKFYYELLELIDGWKDVKRTEAEAWLNAIRNLPQPAPIADGSGVLTYAPPDTVTQQ